MSSRSRRHGRDGDGTLEEAWRSLLFNSFHDILPGSSIERAFDEKIAWLGGAYHAAQSVEFHALNALAAKIDTRVQTPPGDMPSGVALLVWNPHPHAYRGPVELEASLDYRPIWKYHKNVDALPLRVTGADGRALGYQVIETEHHAMVDLAWRKRVVVDVDIPPLGWNVIEMAYVEGASSPAVDNPVGAGDNEISNGIYTVGAKPNQPGIEILLRGAPIFDGHGLSAVTVEDPWGSWGGMTEEKDSLNLSTIRHHWTIQDVRVLERGPLRAAMWVRMIGGNSRLDLTFSLARGRDAIDVRARVLWNERSARLKLVMPGGDHAEFQVPGATVERPANIGQVPGGRWVRVTGPRGTFGFASDALYDFDCTDGVLRATVCRASRYAEDVNTPPDHEPWRPAVDAGELKFNFLIDSGGAELPRRSRELEQPPVSLLVPPHEGKLGRNGSLAELTPATFQVLALKGAEDGNGVILRVQETAGRPIQPRLKLLGKPVRLPKVLAHRIATWRLRRTTRGWKVTATDATEL